MKLCCGRKKCPEVTRQDDRSVKIKDDYGQEVVIEEVQWDFLKTKINEV